ncbi:MAG: hypothetical protein ACQ9MH_27060 [Nitrospinales bacterium]
MPLTGNLTRAQIIDAVAERDGFTRKKSIETVEILLELIKHRVVLETTFLEAVSKPKFRNFRHNNFNKLLKQKAF